VVLPTAAIWRYQSSSHAAKVGRRRVAVKHLVFGENGAQSDEAVELVLLQARQRNGFPNVVRDRHNGRSVYHGVPSSHVSALMHDLPEQLPAMVFTAPRSHVLIAVQKNASGKRAEARDR